MTAADVIPLRTVIAVQLAQPLAAQVARPIIRTMVPTIAVGVTPVALVASPMVVVPVVVVIAASAMSVAVLTVVVAVAVVPIPAVTAPIVPLPAVLIALTVAVVTALSIVIALTVAVVVGLSHHRRNPATIALIAALPVVLTIPIAIGLSHHRVAALTALTALPVRLSVLVGLSHHRVAAALSSIDGLLTSLRQSLPVRLTNLPTLVRELRTLDAPAILDLRLLLLNVWLLTNLRLLANLRLPAILLNVPLSTVALTPIVTPTLLRGSKTGHCKENQSQADGLKEPDVLHVIPCDSLNGKPPNEPFVRCRSVVCRVLTCSENSGTLS